MPTQRTPRRPARLFFAIFLAILVHRAYGPKKSVNFSLDFDYKIKEEIELSIRSIGPMPQNHPSSHPDHPSSLQVYGYFLAKIVKIKLGQITEASGKL